MANSLRLNHSLLVLLLVLLPVVASGCIFGEDSIQNSVSRMAQTIENYDRSSPTDVASTGSACQHAANDLRGLLLNLGPPSLSKPIRSAKDAVQRAYGEALKGFTDCQVGAERFSYVLMARAEHEIVQANVLIDRARRLDR